MLKVERLEISGFKAFVDPVEVRFAAALLELPALVLGILLLSQVSRLRRGPSTVMETI